MTRPNDHTDTNVRCSSIPVVQARVCKTQELKAEKRIFHIWKANRRGKQTEKYMADQP